MNIVSAKSPKWANPMSNAIDLDVNFLELDDEFVPFTASPEDSEAHSIDLYNRAVAGEFGDIAPFEPKQTEEGDEAMGYVREIRDELLKETDFMDNQSYRANQTEEKLAEIDAYRQALRDVPQNTSNPVLYFDVVVDDENTYHEKKRLENVTWPDKP